MTDWLGMGGRRDARSAVAHPPLPAGNSWEGWGGVGRGGMIQGGELHRVG